MQCVQHYGVSTDGDILVGVSISSEIVSGVRICLRDKNLFSVLAAMASFPDGSMGPQGYQPFTPGNGANSLSFSILLFNC